MQKTICLDKYLFQTQYIKQKKKTIEFEIDHEFQQHFTGIRDLYPILIFYDAYFTGGLTNSKSLMWWLNFPCIMIGLMQVNVLISNIYLTRNPLIWKCPQVVINSDVKQAFYCSGDKKIRITNIYLHSALNVFQIYLKYCSCFLRNAVFVAYGKYLPFQDCIFDFLQVEVSTGQVYLKIHESSRGRDRKVISAKSIVL